MECLHGPRLALEQPDGDSRPHTLPQLPPLPVTAVSPRYAIAAFEKLHTALDATIPAQVSPLHLVGLSAAQMTWKYILLLRTHSHNSALHPISNPSD